MDYYQVQCMQKQEDPMFKSSLNLTKDGKIAYKCFMTSIRNLNVGDCQKLGEVTNVRVTGKLAPWTGFKTPPTHWSWTTNKGKENELQPPPPFQLKYWNITKETQFTSALTQTRTGNLMCFDIDTLFKFVRRRTLQNYVTYV